MNRVLAVGSGKGGTGKTSVSVNLALALGRLGRRVCLLDADLGLSNVDVLLGVTPEWTLEHVLFDGVPLEQAAIPAAPGVDVIPGGSGVARLADLDRPARLAMAREFSKLAGYHYLVVDGSPGVSAQVVSLFLSCPELLLVTNPDPAALTDAYALVKVLSGNGLRRAPSLVVNRVSGPEQGRDIFERLRRAMARHLSLDLRYAGHVPRDHHVAAAAARQRALVKLFPAAPAARALMELAGRLDTAGAPPGTDPAGALAFAKALQVRMREAAQASGAPSAGPDAVRALDDALSLLDSLGPAAGPGDLERLRALVVRARTGLDLPARRERPGGRDGAGVAVISSDESIGQILAESLRASGMEVNPDGAGRTEAAVVYWRGDPDGLARRMAGLGEAGLVFVRSVASHDAPPVWRGATEVMDMPFRVEDLAGAVRRMASRGQGKH
ncbi:Flagellum site-determining protein YlxH [Fundidesulfovibrio magnetotacticus]|uniref:Flagellum site-determining protein YlxH n=1 Tax=Fundidesulfovibrio magnetotacticus TaxID=2730080 RepID=A0A6V8LQC9_9BACT|nr:P-loop NTPase [Fundidesulfovibrio magnetotacticus]GFK92761.1 Flagellum site-determining protein YlxH [Fundidesulfovibrio magnetotacticus]